MKPKSHSGNISLCCVIRQPFSCGYIIVLVFISCGMFVAHRRRDVKKSRFQKRRYKIYTIVRSSYLLSFNRLLVLFTYCLKQICILKSFRVIQILCNRSDRCNPCLFVYSLESGQRGFITFLFITQCVFIIFYLQVWTNARWQLNWLAWKNNTKLWKVHFLILLEHWNIKLCVHVVLLKVWLLHYLLTKIIVGKDLVKPSR